MSRFMRWVTGPRIDLLETIAAIPTLPGFAVLAFTLLEGEFSVFSALIILFWMGWGIVLIAVVSLGTVLRSRLTEPPASPKRGDIVLVCCYVLGWGLFAGSYYVSGRSTPETSWLEAAFALGIAVSTVSAGLLSLLVFARFVRLAVASVR